MLRFRSGVEFASGVARYSLQPVPDPKLSVQVEIDGIQTLAVVDTAAPYLVCSLWMATELHLSLDARIGLREVRTNRGLLRGGLYRVAMKVLAAQGIGVEIQATAMVPHADQEHWRDAPTFLGFDGCLERLRFAVDPAEEKFYFGPCP